MLLNNLPLTLHQKEKRNYFPLFAFKHNSNTGYTASNGEKRV